MITLHHCPQTRSMRTLWLLNELEVEFQLRVHAFDRSLRDPEYLTLSPAGRVPALEIDGERMFETGAITEYLCERFPEAGLGRAPGEPERVDWLIWLHFAETLSQHTAALTQQHVALYDDSMRSPVVMRLEARRLEKCYGAVEARLAGRDTLLEGGFSAADIGVAQAIYMGQHFARIEPFARLAAWYGRVTDRAGFRAALPPKGATLLYQRAFYAPWDG